VSVGVSDLSLLVVGLVRNCESVLAHDVKKISAALEGVSSLQWFVVESDSVDKTVSVLQDLKAKSGDFQFVSLGDIRQDFPERTERLAHCRNFYLTELSTNPKYANVDLVMMVDLDGINSKFSRDGFESCFHRTDWDACFANQRAPYYDIWALRHPLWSPVDCWEQYKFLNTVRNNRRLNRQASVYSKMIRIPAKSPWIQVDSAFGGLAIYRAGVLKDVYYSGVSGLGKAQSEHVALNLELVRRGHLLFINPGLINSGYNEHSRTATLRAQLVRLIRETAGRFMFTHRPRFWFRSREMASSKPLAQELQ